MYIQYTVKILITEHTGKLALFAVTTCTGSVKTCQDACIFENHFLAFYNSVMQGDYNALCFTSVACSVAKLRAPPFPCSAEERLE